MHICTRTGELGFEVDADQSNLSVAHITEAEMAISHLEYLRSAHRERLVENLTKVALALAP